MTKREVDLTDEWINKIVGKAKEHNPRDYLLFRLYATKGFRRGEIVGSEARRWDKTVRKWFHAEPNLPGLRIEDLREDGIWVQGKGWKKSENPNPPEFVRLSKELVQLITDYVGKRKSGKIIEMDPSRVNQLYHQYAKEAGHPDWARIHPHRTRHWGGTKAFGLEGKDDLRAANTFLRHKSMASTFRYIMKQTPEQRVKTMDMMEAEVSA